MAAFARSTFSGATYAAFRPTYPKQLYDFVYNYHQHGALPSLNASRPLPSGDRWTTAVDLGCGTGQATVALAEQFQRVIGVEPSQSMIAVARKLEEPSIEFVQSSAEDLSFLPDSSVSLITAAQAAHWFDWGRLWPEVARTLQPHGTAAFWIYSELRLPEFPALEPLITEYAQGSNPLTSIGPHFQRPGRTILERHLVDIPDPEQDFDKPNRVYFTGSHYENSLPADSTYPVILQSVTTWGGLMNYFRTWSGLHTFLEKYPDDAAQSWERGGKGNIAERFWMKLLDEAGKKEEDALIMEWPMALIMAKRR